jgi:glycosyltransferase involved in cell wall biosynthesis
MSSQRISIIIPTLEEERHLPLLLQDIAKQTLLPHEVIVVDGNSQDRTRDIAKKFGAMVLTPGKGVALQRSAGGSMAIGDILVFLDADVRLEPHALERMYLAFEKRRYHVACPWFWPGNAAWSVRCVFLLFTGIFWLTQRITPSGAGCCIVVTKAHFTKVGGFSERHTYDDIAFIRKAGRKGRYGILPVRVVVSDRRYRTEGTARVLLTYLVLSPFFALGCFGLANIVRYRFAHYNKS